MTESLLDFRYAFLFSLIFCFGWAHAFAASGQINSSGCLRDLYLPPGTPSVAIQIDENAILWNPSGIGLSSNYYVGYAWKGIYLDGKKEAANQFFLVKSRGFGFGFMHDSYSIGVKTSTLLAISPPIMSRFSIGFTGKWRGGFNFDCGTTIVPINRIRIGVVGRNLRKKPDVPRYLEGGVAAAAIRNRLTIFADVIFDQSDLRKTTTFGGGLIANWGKGLMTSFSFFKNQDGITTIRAGIRIHTGPNIIEGEYWESSDNRSSISTRLSYQSR